MKTTHFLAIGLSLAGAAALQARSDEAQAWIEAGVVAEKAHDPAAALTCFRKADQLRPDDPWVLQKVARQLSDIAFLESDAARNESLVTEALDYAFRAVELGPDSAENRLSLSILYGRLAAHRDVRTKVDFARRIRQHAEEAIALDPGYSWAHHVLGRWHLEMHELGATRRALATLLFGGLPRASLDEGVRLLERAVALEPDAIAHRVELGFAYARSGRRDQAEAQWRRALERPSVELYDDLAKDRARLALGETGAASAAKALAAGDPPHGHSSH